MEMNFRTKFLAFNFMPLLLFVVISLVIGITQFRSSIYAEKEGNLKSVALAALTLYSTLGYGDYRVGTNGDVWRGINTDLSKETGIVDDLKRQTGVDITLYFNDRAIMTSVMDAQGRRYTGTKVDENIQLHTLERGEQLWCSDMDIGGVGSLAYVLPIRQVSSGAVVGALMASQPSGPFNAIMIRYVLMTMFVLVLVFLMVFIFIVWRTEWFMQKFLELANKSRKDLLTGLCNKLTFENDTASAFAQRQPGDTAILMIFDFDDFKQVNDTYGHQVGDCALKAFAGILLRAFRPHDIVGRVGGDEFMAFLWGTSEEDLRRADEIAQEVLQGLRELKCGAAGPFSCSIGIGTGGEGYDFQMLYRLADRALYKAKERGKACFVRYGSEIL